MTNLLADIAEALNTTHNRPSAFAENFMGCIGITSEDGKEWMFGTINETWGGNTFDNEDGYVETGIPSTSTDVATIAAAIHTALGNHTSVK